MEHPIAERFCQLARIVIDPASLARQDQAEPKIGGGEQGVDEALRVLVLFPPVVPQHDWGAAVATRLHRGRVDAHRQHQRSGAGCSMVRFLDPEDGQSGEEVFEVKVRVEGDPVGGLYRAPVDGPAVEIGPAPVVRELVLVQVEQGRDVLVAG